MSNSLFDSNAHEKLKSALQSERDSGMLEKTAAALLSRLLDVPVAIASSGFQFGGDAGPGGQQGRRFRLECKKYKDTTNLDERELRGEIDQAVGRDPALEAWILITTRQAPEQLIQSLVQKGEKEGVPVIIIDWSDQGLSRLAALCAFAPDLVEAHFSADAAGHAKLLQPASVEVISSLRRQLQSWCFGFEALRSCSHDKLHAIWHEPRVAGAELGQDAAGGAHTHRIRRQSVHGALARWSDGPARQDAPAVLTGWDGVGKTWSALDWLIATKAEQPIVIVVPSSSAATLVGLSETSVKRFIGERLHELSGVRDAVHWTSRLERLLQRPAEEGPVLTVLLDGMNQEPSVQWLQLLKIFQGPAFAGRVRILASTRVHHFEDKLAKLRGLVVAAERIAVDRYDLLPGGELDQMLAFEKLSRSDLHPDLIELARTPRLFKLVIQFRLRLVAAGQVTVHRLLWEYGRDSFGERAGKSFSEDEWQAWLGEIARNLRDGVKQFTIKSLGETAARADLDKKEVYRRLSDIIDGRIVQSDPAGGMQLVPMMVAHALGAALLSHLDQVAPRQFHEAEDVINRWLDPISGFDQRAEILRAAVSILVEKDARSSPAIAGALVAAWLQTQNVTDAHRREIEGLAAVIPDALLDTVEYSRGNSQQSARVWALRALRAIPRTDEKAFDVLVERGRRWVSFVSRDVEDRKDRDENFERRRAERYVERVGRDASETITVLGVQLQFVDRDDGTLASLLPMLLDGFKLVKAMPCFEVAAIALAVRGRLECWAGLKWLSRFNECDPEAMREALRSLSRSLQNRTPEAGIHAQLPALAGTLILWLSGEDADETAAIALHPGLNNVWSYEKDYLAQPSRSFFALERRHAVAALDDKDVPLIARIQRANEFLLDPEFEPSVGFVDELKDYAASFPVESLFGAGGYTREQHHLEVLRLPLARCAPDALTQLERNIVSSFKSLPSERRYFSALHSTEAFIALCHDEAAAASQLRQAGKEADKANEGFAAGRLLMVEIRDLDAVTQIDRLIEADLPFIADDFCKVIKAPTANDVDSVIARWGKGNEQQQHDLIIALSCHQISFSDTAWDWLAERAFQQGHKLKGLLLRMLGAADASRLGRALLGREWTWDPKSHLWENHYGTEALIAAGGGVPFDQLAPRLAPWQLLQAVQRRGRDPSEAQLASEIISHVVMAGQLEAPDPGSDLIVERHDGENRPLMVWPEPRSDARRAGVPFAGESDPIAQLEAHRRAVDTATERIDVARREGASLYLTDISPGDIELVLEHKPELVEAWLEGYQAKTTEFVRRVRLAEVVYMALCEALLVRDPARGVELWRVLNDILTTRYLGAAEIADMLHMPFRVPSTAPVDALRASLLHLADCHDDRRLYDIALAASYNGCSDWLLQNVEIDRKSPHLWQRRRAVILSGFVSGSALPVPEAWPEGWQRTTELRLATRTAQRRFREAAARHWWRAYLYAATAEHAYAAWVLFVSSSDRRAHVWMKSDLEASKGEIAMLDIKAAHWRLNRSELKRAMNKALDKLDRTFLDDDTVTTMSPWASIG